MPFPCSVAVDACDRCLSASWLPRRLRLNRLWVKIPPGFLLWASDGGVANAIHLLGGIVKISIPCRDRWGKFGDESPSWVLLPMLMASVDVIPFLKASLVHFGSRVSTGPTALITGVALFVLCLRVLQPTHRIGLSCLGVWCCCSHSLFTVDTWPLWLSLRMLCRCCCSGGYSAANVALVSPLKFS